MNPGTKQKTQRPSPTREPRRAPKPATPEDNTGSPTADPKPETLSVISRAQKIPVDLVCCLAGPPASDAPLAQRDTRLTIHRNQLC